LNDAKGQIFSLLVKQKIYYIVNEFQSSLVLNSER